MKKPKSLGGQTRLSDPLDIRDVARAHNPALGSDVIRETRALQAAVIPVPPWREESTRQTFGNALSTDWIPAFAGMTALQMTPLPDASCPSQSAFKNI